MEATKVISLRIATLVASGLSIKDAVDAVIGAGSYDRLASDVYDALKAR